MTRPVRGYVILPLIDALREAEEFLLQFPVLYPKEAVIRNAIRGCATYQLSWFDAHLWSCAEHYGLSEIITEDLQHDRVYGTVRAVEPVRRESKGWTKTGVTLIQIESFVPRCPRGRTAVCKDGSCNSPQGGYMLMRLDSRPCAPRDQ